MKFLPRFQFRAVGAAIGLLIVSAPLLVAQGSSLSAGLSELPPVSYEGYLQGIARDLIVVDMDDGRPFNFKRTGSTKFFKNSREVRPEELKSGDRLLLEARLGERAFLYADKVTFKLLTPEEAAEKAAERTVRAASEFHTTSTSSPVMKRGDSGPVLKRRVSSEEPAEVPAEENDESKGARPSAALPARNAPPHSTPVDNSLSNDDPLIVKAASAAFSFSDSLPNFLCEERMGRFTGDPRMTGWEPLDTVTAEVIYENGQESYRNLKIDGRPTEKKMEQLSGSWSTGEFATTLQSLFHPASATSFQFAEYSRLLDRPAHVYDFEVKQEHSHWNVQMNYQKITPGYKGSVWIEPESGRVLRMEMHAVDLPEDFPMDQVESAVEYAFVPIGAKALLLPVHAENLGCPRGSNACSRNVIDFRKYREYVSESTIKFDQ